MKLINDKTPNDKYDLNPRMKKNIYNQYVAATEEHGKMNESSRTHYRTNVTTQRFTLSL